MSTHGKKYVSQCWLQVPHVDFWKNSSTPWVKRFRFTSCFPMRSVEQLLSQVLRMTKKLTRRRSVDWDHPVYMDLKSFLVKQKNKTIHQQNDAKLNTKVEDGPASVCVCYRLKHLIFRFPGAIRIPYIVSAALVSSPSNLRRSVWKTSCHIMPNRGHYITNPCMLRANPTKVL